MHRNRKQLNVERLRGELQEWLAESVAARMAEVEARLKAEAERGQKQMLSYLRRIYPAVIERRPTHDRAGSVVVCETGADDR